MGVKIATVSQLISLWPSSDAFGDDLGLKRGGDHARVMKVRNRIAKHHWPRVVESAKRRSIGGVSEQILEALHRSPAEASAA